MPFTDQPEGTIDDAVADPELLNKAPPDLA